MKPFNRTVEKVLAWIANVLLIFVSILLGILKFSGFTNELIKSPDFYNSFKKTINEQGQYYTDAELKNGLNIAVGVIDAYTILVIVITILAIIATFVMKKRILSGVMFLLISIVVFVISASVAIFIYLPQFIVAIMLFVRKDPNQDNINDNSNQVDTIEYV